MWLALAPLAKAIAIIATLAYVWCSTPNYIASEATLGLTKANQAKASKLKRVYV